MCVHKNIQTTTWGDAQQGQLHTSTVQITAIIYEATKSKVI